MTQASTTGDHSVAPPPDAARTDWTIYQVPTLAEFLSDNLDPAEEQVGAWNVAHNTIGQAASSLIKARAALADAWPPEHSNAAAAYFQFVDELIASMQATADAAIANRNALGNTLGVIGEAKADIDLLHAEWRAYAVHTDIIGVSEQQDAATAGDSWAQDLNARAQQRMITTDEVIFGNTQALVVPTVFQPRSGYETLTRIDGSAGSARTRLAPSETGVSPDTGAAQAITSPVLATSGNPPGTNSMHIDHTGASHGPLRDNSIVPPTSEPWRTGSGPLSPGHTQSGNGQEMDDLVRQDAMATSGPRSTPNELPPATSDDNTVVRATSSTLGVNDATAPAPSMFAPGMTGRIASGESQRGRRTSRRTLWRMPAGAPSVIEATADVDSHDPGPGVIGIDR